MVEYHDDVNPPDPQKLMSPQQVARFFTDVVHEHMSVNTARKRMEEGWFEERGVGVEAWGRSLRVVRDDLYEYLLRHHARAMTRVAREYRARGLDAGPVIGRAVAQEVPNDEGVIDRMRDSIGHAVEESQKKKGPPPPE